MPRIKDRGVQTFAQLTRQKQGDNRRTVAFDWYSEAHNGPQLNPCLSRMGDHFVIADFMYNDSVIRKADTNFLPQNRQSMTDDQAEHFYRMAVYADTLVYRFGPCSISYGYISPEQSRLRVKWQDPNKPSYHRWDSGCAADMLFHDQIGDNVWSGSPHHFVTKLIQRMDDLSFSRILTYSESPWVCVGTGLPGSHINPDDRQALYFNVWQGEPGAKPLYLNFTKNDVQMIRNGDMPTKVQIAQDHVIEHGWQGGGFPSYHGGAMRQTQHIRLGRWLMLSDVLRHSPNIYKWHGDPWHCRPPAKQEDITHLRRKVEVLDEVFDNYYTDYWGFGGVRVSILSAFNGVLKPYMRFFPEREREDRRKCDWDGNSAEYILSISKTSTQGNPLNDFLHTLTASLDDQRECAEHTVRVAEAGNSTLVWVRYDIHG